MESSDHAPFQRNQTRKCLSAPNECPVHGTRLLANRRLGVIKKAIEDEREDDHPCAPGEHGASTSAVLHPLPGDTELEVMHRRASQGVAGDGVAVSEMTP